MPDRQQSIPRRLYRYARQRAAAREEGAFEPKLRFDESAGDLVLSPHFDDAVLDCWGVLAGPGAVEVVNVCAAVPDAGSVTLWDAITGASDSAERVRERVAEDAAALAIANRKPHNLTFLDAQYRRPPAPTLAGIDAQVSAAVPAASRVYAPAGIGSHPDHQLTRRYARQLLAAGMPVTLYAELPYCVNHGWPTWVDGREPDAHRVVDPFWQSFLQDVPELGDLRAAGVVRLDDALAESKLAAMHSYRTQFSALSYGARGMLDDPEIYRYEVRWALARP
jgi:LmbE family N-acetylglucosaminyl deacetylase